MKAKFIKIGNSYGIRIPNSLLRECGIEDIVEVEVRNGQIVIAPVKRNRASWDAAFKKMAGKQDDLLLDNELLLHQTNWEQKEWEW